MARQITALASVFVLGLLSVCTNCSFAQEDTLKSDKKTGPVSKISGTFKYAFDFGTESSPANEPFKRVSQRTLYSPRVGYGWRQSDSVKAGFKKSGSNSTTLSTDWNWGEKNSSFLVDVPNGDYDVWLLANFDAEYGQIWGDYHVQAEDGPKHWIGVPETYIFADKTFRATVKDGQLEIKFCPQLDWVISGLIVCPVSESARMKKLTQALLAEARSPSDMTRDWREVTVETEQPEPTLSSEDVKRGYQIFVRPWVDNVYPNTIPRQGEIKQEISIFATLGEYEPATFSVYPLKDLYDVEVKMSALASKEKQTIPKENIDLRVVRYSTSATYGEHARMGKTGKSTYSIVPDILEKKERVDLRAKQSKTFWVTVKVPEDAVAGEYTGKITFTPGNAPETNLLLRLNVLPIRLKRDPTKNSGMYYDFFKHKRASPRNEKIKERIMEVIRREFIDMREHEMTTICPFCDFPPLFKAKGEEVEFLPEGLDLLKRWMGVFTKDCNFKGPIPLYFDGPRTGLGLGKLWNKKEPGNVPDISYLRLTKAVRLLIKAQQENGWPELLFYPLDEPAGAVEKGDNPEQREAAIIEATTRLMKAVKAAGGRTFLTVSYVAGSHYTRMAETLEPYVDVACEGGSGSLSQEEIAKKRAKHPGMAFWAYPNKVVTYAGRGVTNHTRMIYGFQFRNSGYECIMPCRYMAGNTNALDGRDSYIACPGPKGFPIPTNTWEAVREGIDDGKYIYTLESLVKRAEKEKRLATEIKEARALLQEIREKVEKTDFPGPWGWRKVQKGFWPGAEYDALRLRLAEKIMSLSKQLEAN